MTELFCFSDVRNKPRDMTSSPIFTRFPLKAVLQKGVCHLNTTATWCWFQVRVVKKSLSLVDFGQCSQTMLPSIFSSLEVGCDLFSTRGPLKPVTPSEHWLVPYMLSSFPMTRQHHPSLCSLDSSVCVQPACGSAGKALCAVAELIAWKSPAIKKSLKNRATSNPGSKCND